SIVGTRRGRLRPNYRLRFVVVLGASHFRALSVCNRACNRSALSIGGHDDRAVTNSFAILLSHHVDGVFAVHLERALIGLRIAGDRIEFAVQFAGPFAVSFLTSSVSSLDCAFVLVSNFFPHYERGFTSAVAEGGFAFVQFPRAQRWV